MEVIEEQETKYEQEEDKMLEPIFKDRSPAAKRARLIVAGRAMVGEFVGTCLLMFVAMAVTKKKNKKKHLNKNIQL
jgi:glycerol uptake facilitator-like aquaporin